MSEQNKNAELLPCPFCGSDCAKITFDHGTYEPGCPHCGTFIGHYSSERSAASAWNRRAAPHQVQEGAAPSVEVCTDPDNCGRCKGRGGEHAGRSFVEVQAQPSKSALDAEYVRGREDGYEAGRFGAVQEGGGEALDAKIEAMARAMERHATRFYEWTDEQFEVWVTKDRFGVRSMEKRRELLRVGLAAVATPPVPIVSAPVGDDDRCQVCGAPTPCRCNKMDGLG